MFSLQSHFPMYVKQSLATDKQCAANLNVMQTYPFERRVLLSLWPLDAVSVRLIRLVVRWYKKAGSQAFKNSDDHVTINKIRNM